MTDLELADKVQRFLLGDPVCGGFSPNEWQQIIAALRRWPPSEPTMQIQGLSYRAPERPPSGKMVMALQCAEYALSHPTSNQVFALNAVRDALSAVEASKEAK